VTKPFSAPAITLALLLAACEKSPPDRPSATEPAAPGASASAVPGMVEVTTKSGVKMVYLPGAEYQMGNDRGNPDEAPAHRVRVTGFLIDKHEVTHALFTQAQLPNPSHWQDNPAKPVERVRWRDAKQYCNERSLLEGFTPCYNEKTLDWDCNFEANGYRLPTEAEWEYACRGTETTTREIGRPDKLRQYAWFAENSDQKTHPVGQKRPNAFGIFDLLGNVSEWCEDVYSATYYKESPPADPTGPPSTGKDVRRVIRGGSWRSSAEQCGPTARQGEKTGDSDACFSTDFCGFRCVRRPTEAELKALPGPK
jgi:formylglycine-generating enzyme required for sulfatase activity